MANRGLKIAAGIARGIQDGYNKYEVIKQSRAKLDQEKQSFDLEKKLKNVQMEKALMDGQISKEQLEMNKSKNKVYEGYVKANTALKEQQLDDADQELKNNTQKIHSATMKIIFDRADGLRQNDLLSGRKPQPEQIYMNQAKQELNYNLETIKEAETMGDVVGAKAKNDMMSRLMRNLTMKNVARAMPGTPQGQLLDTASTIFGALGADESDVAGMLPGRLNQTQTVEEDDPLGLLGDL